VSECADAYRNANFHAEMIVMSRHLRTWNIPECRQVGVGTDSGVVTAMAMPGWHGHLGLQRSEQLVLLVDQTGAIDVRHLVGN
jgi:hypothetical protein